MFHIYYLFQNNINLLRRLFPAMVFAKIFDLNTVSCDIPDAITADHLYFILLHLGYTFFKAEKLLMSSFTKFLPCYICTNAQDNKATMTSLFKYNDILSEAMSSSLPYKLNLQKLILLQRP